MLKPGLLKNSQSNHYKKLKSLLKNGHCIEAEVTTVMIYKINLRLVITKRNFDHVYMWIRLNIWWLEKENHIQFSSV